MKILTRTHAEWNATLNVVSTGEGRFGWEVDVHDPQLCPHDQTVVSPVDFNSSTNAAVDGLRAMDGIAEQGAPDPSRPTPKE